MKDQFSRAFSALLLLSALAISCDPSDQNVKPEPTQDLTQIERIEEEEGITLFKKDFTFSEGGTNAVLTLATRNRELFERVIENLEVSFSLLYETDNTGTTSSTVDEGPGEPASVEGDELIVEFTKMERAKGVIGIETRYKVIKEESVASGRQSSHDYPFYVNHYSNHWPNTYKLTVTGTPNRTGLHFYARWKWYQGYGSRTVCIHNTTQCGSVGACSQDFDLYGGNCSWTFWVDGPYQMQAKVGYYDVSDWTDAWTY